MSSWEVLIDHNPLYTYVPPYNINNKYIPEMLLDLEVSKAGQFTFKVYDGHPLFSDIHMLKSTVSITDENHNVRFFGRPISDTIDFDNVHTIVCEGALAYLNDVVIRPSVINVTGFNNSGLIFVQKYLEKIIELYNLYASPNSRKFRVGNITVNPTPFRGVWRVIKNTEYISVMDYIRQYLIDVYGGYLQVREGYDEDAFEHFVYLDYLADLTDTGTQGITFAQNLLDIQTDMDGASLVTAIIPIGKGEDDNTITISSIADGAQTATISKTGDYIYSPDAVAEYGHISQVIQFENASDAQQLLDAAINYFVLVRTIRSKTEFTAVDLHYATGYTVPAFKEGTVIPVTSAPHQSIHGFDNTALIRKLSINLLNPAESKLTVETTVTL